jgi:hypothetical protein
VLSTEAAPQQTHDSLRLAALPLAYRSEFAHMRDSSSVPHMWPIIQKPNQPVASSASRHLEIPPAILMPGGRGVSGVSKPLFVTNSTSRLCETISYGVEQKPRLDRLEPSAHESARRELREETEPKGKTLGGEFF